MFRWGHGFQCGHPFVFVEAWRVRVHNHCNRNDRTGRQAARVKDTDGAPSRACARARGECTRALKHCQCQLDWEMHACGRDPTALRSGRTRGAGSHPHHRRAWPLWPLQLPWSLQTCPKSHRYESNVVRPVRPNCKPLVTPPRAQCWLRAHTLLVTARSRARTAMAFLLAAIVSTEPAAAVQ